MLQSLALICGFKATSDLPQLLSGAEREALREFLLSDAEVTQSGREKFTLDGQEVDFSPALELPSAPAGWTAIRSAAFNWLADQRWALRLDHELGQRTLQRRIRRLGRERRRGRGQD